MITRLSDPVNGLEIWRRFLEEWEPVNRSRYRAVLMQLLQCPLMGSSTRRRLLVQKNVSATRLQDFDALKKHENKEKEKSKDREETSDELLLLQRERIVPSP